MSCSSCGNNNSFTSCGCSDNCPSKTSDITLFDGVLSSINVPIGADLNDVLALLELFVLNSVNNLSLNIDLLPTNCLGLPAGTYGIQQVMNAIIDTLCSIASDDSVLFKSMPIQLSINQPSGFPYTGTPFTIADGVTSEITPITLTVVNAGNYIVTSEFVIDGGTPWPAWVGYELRVNGVVIPYSTRVVRIVGGTPSDNIESFCVNAQVSGLNIGDQISLWIANQTSVPNPYSVLVLGGSMEARSF